MAAVQLTDELLQYPDRAAEWYEDKVIFITGGTGFMGKVLVEKLLRCCGGLKKMYLLVRTRKGKEPNERLKEIFNGPLFDLLRKTKGEEIFKKVEAIPGDACEVELGISPEDRKKLAEEVQIIFHCAATIRFDEALRKAVLLNVRGTKYMLEMAKEFKKLIVVSKFEVATYMCQVLWMKNVSDLSEVIDQKLVPLLTPKVFCHVSTSYCHLNERVLYEKPYQPPADPHKIIKACEWMDDEIVDSITDKLLGKIPNSYAFTKALGEALAVEQLDKLPIIILRPSVVVPIWREPIPGWTDNINGPTGLLIGAGKGVIRTMYCKGNNYADYLPVDIAVNALIASTIDYVVFNERRIYNVTSSAEYKVSWEEIIEMGRHIINNKMPLNGVMWYPGGSMKKYKILHYLAFFFYQLVPAVVLDGLLILLGYKPILVKIQKRIYKGYEVFEYYANNQWDFNNDASMQARKLMNPREKETYKLDGDGINYYDYFYHCVHAARLYLLKETDDTIPAAKRHMRVMWCVDKLCKTIIICAFFYFLWRKLIGPLFGMV